METDMPIIETFETRKSRSLKTWISRADWDERLITFNASWFVTSMATGIVNIVLNSFPYPAQWLRDVGFGFWIATIFMFVLYLSIGIARLFRFPQLVKAIFKDFYQMAYLGAIPVSLDTINHGLIIFYPKNTVAVWVAFVIYWVCVLNAMIVTAGLVFVTIAYQDGIELSLVNGTWLLAFIPSTVTSVTGAALSPILPPNLEGPVMIFAFFLGVTGISMSLAIDVIYFWRLIRYNLPPRENIVSCFIPMGPPSYSANAFQNLAIALAGNLASGSGSTDLLIKSGRYSKAENDAVAASIHYIGVIISLHFVALASYWFLQAIFAVLTRRPKKFSVGVWSCVFPMGTYADALDLISEDVNVPGLKEYAAIISTLVVVLWCICASFTIYAAIWKGELIFAPGQEGWNERQTLALTREARGDFDTGKKTKGSQETDWDIESTTEKMSDSSSNSQARKQYPTDPNDEVQVTSDGDAEMHGEERFVATFRQSRPDGTYQLRQSRRRRESSSSILSRSKTE